MILLLMLFQSCIEQLEPQDVIEFHDACIFDMCILGINKTLSCTHLENLAATCMEELGIDVGNWREEYNCCMFFVSFHFILPPEIVQNKSTVYMNKG
jgi:hypothetical protein